jgi:hypothetical protein
MQLYQSKNIPKYMSEFIVYACSYLGIDKLRGEILIEYKRRLSEESYGECYGDRSEVEIHIAQTTFGKTITREDKLKTVAHELTHAYQYLTGKMKCVGEGPEDTDWVTHWKKRKYRYSPDKESNQPWEIEAIKYENLIYENWIKR